MPEEGDEREHVKARARRSRKTDEEVQVVGTAVQPANIELGRSLHRGSVEVEGGSVEGGRRVEEGEGENAEVRMVTGSASEQHAAWRRWMRERKVEGGSAAHRGCWDRSCRTIRPASFPEFGAPSFDMTSADAGSSGPHSPTGNILKVLT